jgi:hypothetical protein
MLANIENSNYSREKIIADITPYASKLANAYVLNSLRKGKYPELKDALIQT